MYVACTHVFLFDGALLIVNWLHGCQLFLLMCVPDWGSTGVFRNLYKPLAGQGNLLWVDIGLFPLTEVCTLSDFLASLRCTCEYFCFTNCQGGVVTWPLSVIMHDLYWAVLSIKVAQEGYF